MKRIRKCAGIIAAGLATIGVVLFSAGVARAQVPSTATTRAVRDENGNPTTDQDLLKLAQSEIEQEEWPQAIHILQEVIRLPESDFKDEAQFQIGVALEKRAVQASQRDKTPPVLTDMAAAYKACAENYPESHFAPYAWDKLTDYFITTKDYSAAVDTCDRIYKKYPKFYLLDHTLLKWTIAEYRLKHLDAAKQRCEELISKYPKSDVAEKGRTFLSIIKNKLQSEKSP